MPHPYNIPGNFGFINFLCKHVTHSESVDEISKLDVAAVVVMACRYRTHSSVCEALSENKASKGNAQTFHVAHTSTPSQR
jgi:hypothetical protein